MLKNALLIFFLAIAFIPAVEAQVVSPEIIQEELKKRGYDEADEEEFRKRMEARGFDVDNIDPNRLPEYQAALEEIAAEMAEEKLANTENESSIPNDNETGEETDETGTAQEGIEESEDDQPQEVADEDSNVMEGVEMTDLPPSKVYGKNLYRDNNIRLFTKNYDVKPTADYILGAGDEVSVSIWGISEKSGRYEISPEGYIKPDRMPRINLKGLTYAKAKELVRSRFAQYYNFRPEEYELTINYTRSINVNIYGEVLNPGSYTIPALNTGVNALVAAGGPSDIGTVRNIRIISGSGQGRQMDLYEFLLDPGVSKDFYLADNDFIYVEVAKRVVEVLGAVNRPMRYELKDGEQLKKLIDFAGGFTDRAYKANIQIKRFENDAEKIIDLDYRNLSSTRDFPLFPGDVVTVNEIPKPYQNYAMVSGAVELESKYEIQAGTRVSDLIAKAILRREARRDMAFLLRRNADRTIQTIQIDLADVLTNRQSENNLGIQPEDELMILSSASFTDNLPINVTGSVRTPRELPYDSDQGVKVADAITLADGLRKDAANFAYVFRTKLFGQKDVEYIRVELDAAMANPNSAANIALQGGDELKVYSQLTFKDELPVKVFGAVRQPGEYIYDPSLQLRDVLSLAGGLELSASRSRIDISRITIDGDQNTKTSLITLEVNEELDLVGDSGFELQPFDQIYVRESPEFELQRNITIRGEVKFPGRHPLLNDNERIMSLIKRAGGLTKEAFAGGATLYRERDGIGYVVMDLKDAQKNPKSPFNIILQQGDIIEIPKLQELVTITGETKASEILLDEVAATGKISAPFEPGKSANYYVETYTAGVGESGRKHLITVEHPNGELQRTKKLLFFNIYPKVREGSIIKVGRKHKKERLEKEKEEIDWGRVFADSITQATAILSLILLLQTVN